jgi:hypothetical protein
MGEGLCVRERERDRGRVRTKTALSLDFSLVCAIAVWVSKALPQPISSAFLFALGGCVKGGL